jgi:hypothetical protein
MQNPDESKKLVAEFSDRSRKAVLSGNKALIPLKYDDQGEILTEETFDIRKHLKRLSLLDLRFLKMWRDCQWDTAKACEKSGIDPKKAERLAKRLQCFREEEARTKALAEIPTPSWVAAKHLENVYSNELEDGQRDSLKELAKITGAYKPTTSVSVQVSLEKPAWTPEQEAKLREVYDTIEIKTNAA